MQNSRSLLYKDKNYKCSSEICTATSQSWPEKSGQNYYCPDCKGKCFYLLYSWTDTLCLFSSARGCSDVQVVTEGWILHQIKRNAMSNSAATHFTSCFIRMPHYILNFKCCLLSFSSIIFYTTYFIWVLEIFSWKYPVALDYLGCTRSLGIF